MKGPCSTCFALLLPLCCFVVKVGRWSCGLVRFFLGIAGGGGGEGKVEGEGWRWKFGGVEVGVLGLRMISLSGSCRELCLVGRSLVRSIDSSTI